ncbi:MAG: hypothetical protein M3256_24325, partial [Actinomycetota bacterium]|nr:hypothetical protein [Actinomycetota bacterium]
SVAGWSYVGLAAALYAATYASHVERLVLTCPAPLRDCAPSPQRTADAKASEQIADLYRQGLEETDPGRFAREWRRIAAQSRMGDPPSCRQALLRPGPLAERVARPNDESD